MTVRYRQSAFDTGEVSPEVIARTDVEKRASALALLENFVSLVHGPATRRMGLEYIAELKDSDKVGRLIPFEFSVDDAYIIVMNDSVFRFYRNGAVIGVPYEVAHSYADADLTDIDHAQSADTLYMAHEDHEQTTLVRSDHDSWAHAEISFEKGPFQDANLTATTLTPSATTGVGITITASAVTGINGGDGFQDSSDVGRLITINHSDTWGIAEITAVGSTTSVTATVLTDFGDTTAQSDWKLGPWCDTHGFPRTVTFAWDRLVWAGSTNFPHYIWASKVSRYDRHKDDATLTDASALKLPLTTGKLNAIRWIRFPNRLSVGTSGAEWWLTDATGDGPITAESKQAVPGSGHGCSGVKPVELGSLLVFLQKHDKVLRELRYDNDTDTFAGEDLTLLVEHLTRESGIIRMAFQRTPYRVLWCVREDGKLLGCTYYREHNVVGWHFHETDGWFEDVAVIPGTNRDEVWFIVKRTINGSTVRYLERMAEPFGGDDTHDTNDITDATDAHFLDSYATLDNRQTIESINTTTDVVTITGHGYSDTDSIRFRVIDDPDATAGTEGSLHLLEGTVSDKTADTFKVKDADGAYYDFSDYTTIDANETSTVAKNTTAISGLDHLEGETVDICADGAKVPSKTVSSGAITLDDSASVVHAGLGYQSNLWTLTPDIPLPLGSSMGAQKRVVAATVQLFQTLGMWVGTTEDNLKEQQFASDAVPAGQPAPLFTGEWEVTLDDQDNTNAQVYVRQTDPLPMTVLAIETDLQIDEVED